MTGGARPEEREPLVVALHGLGDRPETFVHVLTDSQRRRGSNAALGTEYTEAIRGFRFAKTIRSSPRCIAKAAKTNRGSRGPQTKPPPASHRHRLRRGGAGLCTRRATRRNVRAAFPLSGWFPAAIWPARSRATPADRRVPRHRGPDGRSRMRPEPLDSRNSATHRRPRAPGSPRDPRDRERAALEALGACARTDR
jgi:hypothetical protein